MNQKRTAFFFLTVIAGGVFWKIYTKQNRVALVQDSIAVGVDRSPNKKGFVSTFGEAITSPVEDMINIEFQYGISNVALRSDTSGTGKIFAQDSLAYVSAGKKGMARIQSKRNLRYRTGHEGYAFFTGLWGKSAKNSTQFIGLFDDHDGVAVGFNGTTFSILFRRDGDQDSFISQSQFNRDRLDGTGPSDFTLNHKNLNIFRISYGWLGTAPIKFQINASDGSWITFHIIERPNTIPGVSFKSPVLPIRMEVKNNGNNSDLKMGSASWNAGIVGVPTTSGSRYFSKSYVREIGTAGTEVHMMTIRNKSNFQGKPNKVEVRISAIGGGGMAEKTTSVVTRMVKNAMVAGLSFKDIDSNSSVIEVSTGGTFENNTGTELFALPSNTFGNGPNVLFFPRNQFDVILYPGESITLTAQNIIGGTPTSIATLSWEEQF